MATANIPFDISAARNDFTNPCEWYAAQGTSFPMEGWVFPQNSSRAIHLKVGAEDYVSGNWTLNLQWFSPTGATTGTPVWSCQMAAITPGDAQSVLTKALATATTGSQAVNATASGLTQTAVTLSNLDSVAAGDYVEIKITRTDTSMTGNAVLTRAWISYTV